MSRPWRCSVASPGFSCHAAQRRTQPRSDQKPPSLAGRCWVNTERRRRSSDNRLFPLALLAFIIFWSLLAGINETPCNIHLIPNVYKFIRFRIVVDLISRGGWDEERSWLWRFFFAPAGLPYIYSRSHSQSSPCFTKLYSISLHHTYALMFF